MIPVRLRDCNHATSQVETILLLDGGDARFWNIPRQILNRRGHLPYNGCFYISFIISKIVNGCFDEEEEEILGNDNIQSQIIIHDVCTAATIIE